MHNLLFERQRFLNDGNLLEYASELGLDLNQLCHAVLRVHGCDPSQLMERRLGGFSARRCANAQRSVGAASPRVGKAVR
ncbi:MAG: hypothetical protein V7K48_00790 [Nostoc sp.]|uniref:hypothetical protein n=1 Tax=Nostoc sp. TaxID=1180 RepID=UPI002FF677B6